jgi:hypothetical protein
MSVIDIHKDIEVTVDLDAEDARPHISKSSIELCAKPDLKGARHPPYSPDLAPSDYSLFGCVKDKLKSLSFPSVLQLHLVIKRRTVQSID